MNINNNYLDQINVFESVQRNFNVQMEKNNDQKDRIKKYLTVPFITFHNNQDEFECILKINYLIKFNNEEYLKFENIQISNSDGFGQVLYLINKYSFKIKGLVLNNISFSSLDVMQNCWKLLSDMEWMSHLEIYECDFIRHLSWQDHEVLKSKLLTLSVTFKNSSFSNLVSACADFLDHNEVIQSLQFNEIDFFDFKIAIQISELLLSCPHLKDLKFDKCIFSNQSVSVFIKTILAMQSLNSLSLKNMIGFDDNKSVSHDEFLQQWKAILDAQNLISLDLSHYGESKKYNVNSLKNFFKGASRSLGELKIAGMGIENIQDVFDLLKNQTELGIIDLSNNAFQKEEFIESSFNFLLNSNSNFHGRIIVLTFTGKELLFKDREVLECCQYIEEEQKLIFNFKEVDPQFWLFQMEENSNQFTRQIAPLQKISIEDHSIVNGKPVEQDMNKMWIKLHLEQLKKELKLLDGLSCEWILERKKRYLNIFTSKNESLMNEKFFEMLISSLGFNIIDSKVDASLFIYYKIIEILMEQPDQLHKLGISTELNIYKQMEALRSLVASYLINESKSIFLELRTNSHLNFEEYLIEKGMFSGFNHSILTEMKRKKLDNDFDNDINDIEKKLNDYLEDVKSGESEITLFEIRALGILINCNIHIITAKQYFKQIENLNDFSLFQGSWNKNSNMNLYFYKKNGYYYRLKKIN